MTEREALATFLTLKMMCNSADVAINRWHTWNDNFIWPRENPDEVSTRPCDNRFRQRYSPFYLSIMKTVSCCWHHGSAIVAYQGRLVGILRCTSTQGIWILADLVTGTAYQFTEERR